VQQCNKLSNLSALSLPARDLDFVTTDHTPVNVTSTVSNDGDVADEFSSFMFWRQPVSSVAVDDLAAILASAGHLTSDGGDDADDHLASDFDQFNYWRAPIPQLDIADLLRCLHQL